jgi:hypothetical protein
MYLSNNKSKWQDEEIRQTCHRSINAKVIASNRTSIPEVSGGCALLIDPQDEEQLTKALKNIETFSVNKAFLKTHLEKYLHWETVTQIICKSLFEKQ